MNNSAEVIVGEFRYQTKGKSVGVERTDEPKLPDRDEFIEGLNVM